MHWALAHLVGDFIIQNDWMASRKKQDSWACFVHVVTYLIPFLLTDLSIWQILIIGVQHYAQDRSHFVEWFMRKTGKASFIEPPMGPWSVIIVDATLHLVFIAFVDFLM